jgi:hypothetical protein
MNFIDSIIEYFLDIPKSAGLNPAMYERLRKEQQRQQRSLYNKTRVKNIINKQNKTGELIRHKVLEKEKLEILCENECVICQTNHVVENMIITKCCKNYYCRDCFKKWMRMPKSKHTCPTCREKNPTTLEFSEIAQIEEKI